MKLQPEAGGENCHAQAVAPTAKLLTASGTDLKLEKRRTKAAEALLAAAANRTSEAFSSQTKRKLNVLRPNLKPAKRPFLN